MAEEDILDLYTTTIGFTTNFNYSGTARLIAGTREGIYLWDETTGQWSAPQELPDRTDLQGAGLTMDSRDGLYPWTGIIRECPPNTKYLCAGIGNSRDHEFGKGAVLRSINGGLTWELVRIGGDLGRR